MQSNQMKPLPTTLTTVKRGHLRPVYTERQCQRCEDASDSALIETTPIWSNFIVFNKNSIASIDADALCKRAL